MNRFSLQLTRVCSGRYRAVTPNGTVLTVQRDTGVDVYGQGSGWTATVGEPNAWRRGDYATPGAGTLRDLRRQLDYAVQRGSYGPNWTRLA